MGREVEKEEEDVEITYNKLSSRQTSRAEQSRQGKGVPGTNARDCGFSKCEVSCRCFEVRYTLKERLDLEV